MFQSNGTLTSRVVSLGLKSTLKQCSRLRIEKQLRSFSGLIWMLILAEEIFAWECFRVWPCWGEYDHRWEYQFFLFVCLILFFVLIRGKFSFYLSHAIHTLMFYKLNNSIKNQGGNIPLSSLFWVKADGEILISYTTKKKEVQNAFKKLLWIAVLSRCSRVWGPWNWMINLPQRSLYSRIRQEAQEVSGWEETKLVDTTVYFFVQSTKCFKMFFFPN